jgi:hypothetical protein
MGVGADRTLGSTGAKTPIDLLDPVPPRGRGHSEPTKQQLDIR